MLAGNGPPRCSETNTNGDVLVALRFRSADTSSLPKVCTLSLEPSSRRTWKVLGLDPSTGRSQFIRLACFGGAEAVTVHEPEQDLIAQPLPADPSADHRAADF
jgi:hypothetical protein